MNPKQPGIPRVIESSSNSVRLMWDDPVGVNDNIKYYILQYRPIAQKRWVSKETEANTNVLIVADLTSDSRYECRVRAVFNDEEEGPYSVINKDIRTNQSISQSCLPPAVKTTDDKGTFYQFKLKEDVNFEHLKVKTRRCILGTELSSHAIEKTIMLLGETGSGKSTLVDGFVNYLMGVDWEDDRRFRIIDLKDDEEKKKNDQTRSQTEWITCYTIPSMRSEIKYSLNVIDTPGFGDTQGVENDKALVERIQVFFTTPPPKGIRALDAVCFVTQAALSRLTVNQKYIINSVLSLFGKDLSKNIFVLATNADADDPPVQNALKAADVPFQKAFKFNYPPSIFTIEHKHKAQLGMHYWNIGRKSFEDFFIELTTAETISIQLTAEVLDTRKRLEAESQGLQLKLVECLNTIHTILQEKRVIEKHEKDILDNNHFTYEVEETKMDRIPTSRGDYVTNCTICKRTCHDPCTYPKWKRFCYAMSIFGNCKICDKKCSWREHENSKECYLTTVQTVTKTFDNLKKKYEIAEKNANKHRLYLQTSEEKLKQRINEVSNFIYSIQRCNNELDQKAIRHNPPSLVEFIKMSIRMEKSGRKNGYLNRVELLKKFKKQAQYFNAASGIIFIPWTDETLTAFVKSL